MAAMSQAFSVVTVIQTEVQKQRVHKTDQPNGMDQHQFKVSVGLSNGRTCTIDLFVPAPIGQEVLTLPAADLADAVAIATAVVNRRGHSPVRIHYDGITAPTGPSRVATRAMTQRLVQQRDNDVALEELARQTGTVDTDV